MAKSHIVVVLMIETPPRGGARAIKRLRAALREMAAMDVTIDCHHLADLVRSIEDVRQVMRRARASKPEQR